MCNNIKINLMRNSLFYNIL